MSDRGHNGLTYESRLNITVYPDMTADRASISRNKWVDFVLMLRKT